MLSSNFFAAALPEYPSLLSSLNSFLANSSVGRKTVEEIVVFNITIIGHSWS